MYVDFGVGKTQAGFTADRFFFIVPKHLKDTNKNDVGVIGGTFINDATPQTPHEEEFDIVLQGARTFYGLT